MEMVGGIDSCRKGCIAAKITLQKSVEMFVGMLATLFLGYKLMFSTPSIVNAFAVTH